MLMLDFFFKSKDSTFNILDCLRMNFKKIISVDWGTSNLRIRLVNADPFIIIEEIASKMGVKSIYNQWLKKDKDREVYFLNFLHSQISLFNTKIDLSIPIVISGMASSSIGLRELPYVKLPFDTNGKSLYVETLFFKKIFNPIYLISGVKSKSDVIRGEEVQIVGLLSGYNTNVETTVYIFPGSHSKHIVCENDFVTNFKTYMTGEVFEVISNHSILKESLVPGILTKIELSSFNEGVRDSNKTSSILNTLFKVRTNSLFKKKTKIENFYYLSGLLIGEELKYLLIFPFNKLQLCAAGNLFELYNQAIKILGLSLKTEFVSKDIVDYSVIKGQLQILKQFDK